MYVMFSEYASSRFRFSAGTFEEVARQHYGNYALEISWNLDWLIDEGYIEDLGRLENGRIMYIELFRQVWNKKLH